MGGRILRTLLLNFVIGYPICVAISVMLFYRSQQQLMGLILFGDFFIYGALVLSAFTILFLKLKSVKESIGLFTLSFFLLPVCVSVALLSNAGEDFKFYLVCVVTFLIMQIINFIRLLPLHNEP